VALWLLLKVHHTLDRIQALELVWHEEALVDVWNGRNVVAGYAFNWALKIEEALPLLELENFDKNNRKKTINKKKQQIIQT
jgi:hypothetical protein